MKSKPLEDKLGTKVKYARMNQAGEMIEGIGVLMGINIGPDKRKIARVHDGLNNEGRPVAYNIDPVAIDYAAHELQEYAQHLQKIEIISKTSNAQIKEIAEKGNALIDKLNADYMGDVYDI